MAYSANINLPFLYPAQAQKHVFVNESFSKLDIAAQCAVLEMGRTTLPVEADEGTHYLLSDTPEPDLRKWAGQIAAWQNGGFAYLKPKPGWRIYNLADDTLYVMNSSNVWTALTGPELKNLTRFGLGTTANKDNPFVATVNSALWTALPTEAGGNGDLLVKTNRSDSACGVGHLFQTNFVTRAMLGQFGSNRFRISVSPDGSAFRDALVVDDATGIAELPQLPRFKAYTNYDNSGPVNTWTKIGINTAESNDQGVFDPATSLFKAPSAGTYVFGATVTYGVVTSATARFRARLVKGGTAEILGSLATYSGAPMTPATVVTLHTMTVLAKNDTIELQGYRVEADGKFVTGQNSFWGYKVG